MAQQSETVTVQFYPFGMVTTYIVIDASGERRELKKDDIVELKAEDYLRLRKRFPKSFIPYTAPPSDQNSDDQKEVKSDQKAESKPKRNKMHFGPKRNK